ncbi:acyltransferase [Colwellia sp. 39_35_sub15_T18]|nr:acyltransferase [Colwellia sp. 39_35_sub15_T18]
MNRLQVLDGWRGISILFVLAGHLFPLGYQKFQFNAPIAAAGMAIFFILSGFLITNVLLRDQNIPKFLIRRFMRIVPLAWLVLFITFLFTEASTHEIISTLFFYTNWEPIGLIAPTSHFWSLCVEVQFYILIALLVFFLKQKAFYLLPVLCISITCYRYFNDVQIAINTYYRVDEILAGCTLALFYNYGTNRIKQKIDKLPTIILLFLLIASAHPVTEFLNYLRPYIAAILIASTIFSQRETWLITVLKGKLLFYIASTSYAVYIIHGGLRYTWLAEGDIIEKYFKRPLFLLVTFVLAHISTKYYENYWVNLGKKLSNKALKRSTS